MNEPMTELNEVLFQTLQGQNMVLLGTIDAETGAPVQHAISWLYAHSAGQLRFAVDSRSRMIANMTKSSQVSIVVFAGQSLYLIQGTATVHEQLLADVPLKLSCVDVDIHAVRDIMYYGSRITAPPVCEKTYDERAAAKLDGQVFDAMKKA